MSRPHPLGRLEIACQPLGLASFVRADGPPVLVQLQLLPKESTILGYVQLLKTGGNDGTMCCAWLVLSYESEAEAVSAKLGGDQATSLAIQK